MSRTQLRQIDRFHNREMRVLWANEQADQFRLDNPQMRGFNRNQRRSVIRGLRRRNDGRRKKDWRTLS
jgi:hypothetical protein